MKVILVYGAFAENIAVEQKVRQWCSTGWLGGYRNSPKTQEYHPTKDCQGYEGAYNAIQSNGRLVYN